MHTAPIRRCRRRPRRPLRGDRVRRQDRAGLVAHGRRAPAHHPPSGRTRQRRKAYAVAISPDGATIAAGGWTRRTAADPAEQIYLFDRDSGAMIDRITGLPTAIGGLAFDRAGDRLAAALGQGGLRLYACGGTRPCWEIAADVDYGDSSYGVAFDANGQLGDHELGRPAPSLRCRRRAAPFGRNAARSTLSARLQPEGRPAGSRLQRIRPRLPSTMARPSRPFLRRTSAASTTAA